MVAASKIAPEEYPDEDPISPPPPPPLSLPPARPSPNDSGYSASRGSITDSSGSPIEADSFSNTDDGSGKSSEGADTVSVTSNVWKFDKENGRTYHGYRSGAYFYPNDASETERLDYQYQVLQEALSHKLHYAPLTNPETILDIGTGTGAWAIEMGDAYPTAIIEATDLSPIQPDTVPENVQFIIDDASEDDWAVPDGYYDFIHTRIMMGSFEDFGDIIRKGFKYTKPGGWMESQDIMHPPFSDDGTMNADWPFREWSHYIEDAAKGAGRPLRIANKMKRWFIEAGFVDVQERIIKLPINTWPRDKKLKVLGQWWAENLMSGLQGFSLALLSRVFSWSKEEIEVYLVNVRKSLTDRRVHAYHKFYTVWGRKPQKGEIIPPKEELSATRSNIVTDPSNKATPPQPPPLEKLEAEPEFLMDEDVQGDVRKEENEDTREVQRPRKRAATMQALSAASRASEWTGYMGREPAPLAESIEYDDHAPGGVYGVTGYGDYSSTRVAGPIEEKDNSSARVFESMEYEGYLHLPPLPPPKPDGDDHL